MIDEQKRAERNEEIIRRHKAGEWNDEIAEAMGINKSIVKKVTYGVPRDVKRPARSPKERRKLTPSILRVDKKKKPPRVASPKEQKAVERPAIVHSSVVSYHISELPVHEQERIYKLFQPYEQTSSYVGRGRL